MTSLQLQLNTAFDPPALGEYATITRTIYVVCNGRICSPHSRVIFPNIVIGTIATGQYAAYDNLMAANKASITPGVDPALTARCRDCGLVTALVEDTFAAAANLSEDEVATLMQSTHQPTPAS